jgi:ferredoxin-NADP reductase
MFISSEASRALFTGRTQEERRRSMSNVAIENADGGSAFSTLGQHERAMRSRHRCLFEDEEGKVMTTTTALFVAQSKLVSRYEVAEHTTAFRFEKPLNWTFKAGQFLKMTLLEPSETSDDEGNTRTFSIASAPYEETLMVVSRMRDTLFEQELKTMPLGSPVKIEGPSGCLTLHSHVTQTAVFLADGIGITPFRSIVFGATKEKLSHRFFLFYSNRRPEDASFLDELQALEKENPNFKLVASMTEMTNLHQSWHGEVGPIDREMLLRYLRDAVSPIYYIAGPPKIVEGFRTMLNEAGVTDNKIRLEEFAGY